MEIEKEKTPILDNQKPHIQLYDFKTGLFPNERIGYFLSHDGQEYYLEIQKGNSNFTEDGLLEVKVLDSEEDKTLIQVYNNCMPDYNLIKTSDLKYLNQNELEYIKD